MWKIKYGGKQTGKYSEILLLLNYFVELLQGTYFSIPFVFCMNWLSQEILVTITEHHFNFCQFNHNSTLSTIVPDKMLPLMVPQIEKEEDTNCISLRLQESLERYTRGVWNCRARGKSMWPLKPWRPGIQRSSVGTFWVRQASWASSTIPTLFAWRASSPKVGQSWSSQSSWRMVLWILSSG